MKRRTDKGVVNTNKTELQTKITIKLWDILSYGFKLGKVEKRDTQSCRDLPQGIWGTEQAHRLATQW